jgi:aspartyl-tRNA synthetase
MNHFAFVDLRDRYGITQVIFDNSAGNDEASQQRYSQAAGLGREYVIAIEGVVVERSNKNASRPTGSIEVAATGLTVLNVAKTPPFKIEDKTDGGEEVCLQCVYVGCALHAHPVVGDTKGMCCMLAKTLVVLNVRIDA